uniref:alpha-N-acetylgalactosaminide alpha-2,6-sialyltransferase n=1 Tax=Pseudonaja textilis TaxID=8673 RepID=A0A670XXY4_PSETE
MLSESLPLLNSLHSCQGNLVSPMTLLVRKSQKGITGPWDSAIVIKMSQLPSSRSCLSSVKSRVKHNPTFEKQFDFDIPVFMWEQHFTPETWGRLKDRSVPYGWLIASTLQLLTESVHSQLVDETKFLNCCICCAVVGNGGILNGSRQGKKIDAHDFVFRLNGAVTKGFEEDVGTRTSFYGFTVNTMKNSLVAYAEYGFTQIPQGKVKYIFIPSNIRDYIMLRSAILGSPVPEGYDKGDMFLKSEIINSQFGHLYIPSTGALMLLTALHTCDQVSAYGFITENYKLFSDHYYEQEKKPLVFYANHDMLLEAELWKSLNRVGIIKLFQR